MAMKNPATVAKQWADRLGASGQKIREGVEAVQESPMEKAAARTDAWVQGVQRARDDGSYERGLRSVTLAQWKQAMIDKGLNRIGSGAQAAVPKMQQFLSRFLPYVAQGQEMLKSRPRGDLATNIGRMVAMVEHLANFKSSGM